MFKTVKPDVYTYFEYRTFLNDAFEAMRAGTPKLSHRGFAKQLGVSPPNFLQLVIQGKRSLGSTHAVAVARAFKLNKKATEFFLNLVDYEQAKTFEEKKLAYEKALHNKRFAAIKTLDKSQYELFTYWYIPVVRELLMHKEFTGRNQWIADRIFPRITVAQVKSAKALLLKLELMRHDEGTGKWKLANAVISTASEATHLGMRNYHMSTIRLAQASLEAFGNQERDIRSVTIGLSENAYAGLKAKLETVWSEIMEFAGSQQETDKVYQVNMQLFPLTRKPSAKKSEG